MALTKCPDCNHEILERIGTICPNCGHTVGYFEGNDKRKRYGKFFAISVFIPFISFITIIFASIDKTALMIATVFYLALAFISCPIRFNELFFTKYEKMFFWGIWLLTNSLMITMVINLFSKF